MVCVVNKINHKIDPISQSPNQTSYEQQLWMNETIWQKPAYNLEDHLWKFIYAKPKILYSPDNNVTKAFVNELDYVMTQRVCVQKTRVEYIGYDTEKGKKVFFSNLSLFL